MRARGLSDLRTATTSRIHAKPPQKGAEYLNLYLLDKEAQRLEKELEGLAHRQGRIQSHLAEIRKAMTNVEEDTQRERPLLAQAGGSPSPVSRDDPRQPWKRVLVDY